ncbi:MAG TPA: Fe-S protein assembly co-chaperone HscB [Acidobacteriaceae bacterium]|nr:Fe-S protein assembly co-chaperone HscB [Acidobacteriaceae bacterium]
MTTTQTQPGSQPAAQADYFAVFGLPRRLRIDLPQLERSFYRLSRQYHPDLYATKPPEEQQWSLDQTSLLNDAYRTLKNPVSRTEHLLRLEGIVLEAGKSDDGTSKESRVPADLLEEVFELNMQLEEMRMNRKMGEDDPQLRTDLEKARATFESQLAAVDSNLEEQWARWDAALDVGSSEQTAEVSGPEVAKIKHEMVALLDRRRYLRNLVRDVNDALEG